MIKLTKILIIDDCYATVGGIEAYEGTIPAYIIPFVLEERRKIMDQVSPFRDFNPATGKIVLNDNLEARLWLSKVISEANSSFMEGFASTDEY